ncbi:MAG: hypothetical protein KTR31_40450 [Myxococcales bacterium]|nr:hypothetical protein [Myxococcales bacterium]
MTLEERLSALLSGDLSPDDARVLRERIAREPEVGLLWEELQQLASALDDMPLPEVDEALIQRVVQADDAAEQPTRANRRPWGLAAAGLAAAAGLLLGLLVPRAPVDRVDIVVRGDAVHVEGPATVRAGSHVLPVEGSAAIRIGPHTVRVEAPDGTVTAVPRVGDQPTAVPRALPDAQLEEALRTIERLQLELALVRGRLTTHEGTPLSWPEDLPPLLAPEAFARAVHGELPLHPDVELLGVDCSEYPCAAVLYSPLDLGGDRDWKSVLQPLADQLPEPWTVQDVVRTTDVGQTSHEVAVLSIARPAMVQQHGQRLLFRARELITHLQPEEMAGP